MKVSMNERSSNFELLRIVAMMIIIVHHVLCHGIYFDWHYNNTLTECINSFLALSFGLWGRLGVDLFVLITGYFMVNSNFKIKKFFNLLFKSILYSIIIFYLAKYFNVPNLGTSILKRPFDLITSYWFITTYLMLYVCVPFINKFIEFSSREMLSKFIILGSIMWFILPSLSSQFCPYTSYFVAFVYLYILGACIKLGKVDFLLNKHLFEKLSFYSMVFLICYFAMIIYFDKPVMNFNKMTRYLDYSSIFFLVQSVYIFNIFKDLKIKHNKIINWISSSVFGIYLLHESNFTRKYLWTQVFPVMQYMNSKYMILYAIGVSFLVFVLCLVVDKILGSMYNKIFNKVVQVFIKN